MKLAVLVLFLIVGQLIAPAGLLMFSHTTPHHDQTMHTNQTTQATSCEAGGAICQTYGNNCFGHCLATYVVNEQASAVLLPLLFIVIVIASRLITAAVVHLPAYIPRQWFPPRYLFSTVQLIE